MYLAIVCLPKRTCIPGGQYSKLDQIEVAEVIKKRLLFASCIKMIVYDPRSPHLSSPPPLTDPQHVR